MAAFGGVPSPCAFRGELAESVRIDTANIIGHWHLVSTAQKLLIKNGDSTVVTVDIAGTCGASLHKKVTFASDVHVGGNTLQVRESTDGLAHRLEGTGALEVQGEQLYLGSNNVFVGKRTVASPTCTAVHVGSGVAPVPALYLNGQQWPSSGTAGQVLGLVGDGTLVWQDGTEATPVTGWTTSNIGGNWTLSAAGTPALTVTPTGVLTAQSVATTSDRKLKENIVPLPPSARSVLQQLQPVQFDWKATGQTSWGFVAQEVQQVAPHMVATSDNGTLSVKMLELIAVLTAEVQDLRQQVVGLQLLR